MAKAIYVIGPSGVGKTHCARSAAERLQVEYRELDSLSAGRTDDWGFCEEVMLHLEDASQPGNRSLIDIGAGTQFGCTDQLSKYLQSRRERVVLIFAPANEVWRRNDCVPGRSLETFEQMEYTSRHGLYSVAGTTLDITGKTKVEAAALFTDHISKAFSLPAGGQH